MEDIPAGRRIRTDSQPITPRKANNPIGSQSQWSFGWQGNEPKAMNTANSSKGNSVFIQALAPITTKVAFILEMGKSLAGKRKNLIQISRRSLRLTIASLFGTITQNLLERRRWCSETRSLTIEKRTSFISRERLQLSPAAERRLNDCSIILSINSIQSNKQGLVDIIDKSQ